MGSYTRQAPLSFRKSCVLDEVVSTFSFRLTVFDPEC
jgi:hypothetical protein